VSPLYNLLGSDPKFINGFGLEGKNSFDPFKPNNKFCETNLENSRFLSLELVAESREQEYVI
jgi:hypothetical protein